MATIKSYTDIEQSKKLAEILPLESADYCWGIDYESRYLDLNDFPYTEPYNTFNNKEDFIPCWSLAALLNVIPCGQVNRMANSDKWEASSWDNSNFEPSYYVENYDNPVDACVAMIEKLHELNLL